MNTKDLLYETMQDKYTSQRFYNDLMLGIINPSVRELFKKMRDDEERGGVILQQEILAIEAKPFPVNKILGSRTQKYITGVDTDNTFQAKSGQE